MSSKSNGAGTGVVAATGPPVYIPWEPVPEIEAKTADVDWLTVTAKDHGLQELLFNEASRVFTMEKERGNVQHSWGMKGYEGWRVGGFRWGSRDDSSIVMLSGENAALNWPVALAWAENVTRLDLAVTITLLNPMENLAVAAYDFLTMDGQAIPGGKRTYTITESSEGGQTLYIGSRASDQYGRLYDKGKEQDKDGLIPKGKVWRFEVELKKYRAKRVAQQLLASAKREESPVRDEIAATVYKWFLSRGIKPIWPADEQTAFAMEISAKLSDDDVTLQWLATQVSPSVQRLTDNGRGTEVLASLGLIGD